MPGAQRAIGGEAPAVPASVVFVTVALVLLTAVGVTFLKTVSVNAVVTLLMAAVLMVAVVLGSAYALLAGVLALIVYQLLVGAPLASSLLAAGDLSVLVLFSLGALVVGRHTDIARKRDAQARILLQAGQPLSSHASEPALGRFLQRVRLDSRSSEGFAALEEVQRALVSFCVVGAGLAASLLAHDTFGPAAGGFCALAAVLIVAAALGGRFGLAAGLLAAVVLSQAGPMRDAFGIHHTVLARVFIILVFVGAGWGVGRVADQAQHARHTLRAVMDAGRDFSATRDEAAMRRALLDILAKLSPRSRIEVLADTGAERLSMVPSADARQWAEGDPRWRVHPLASDGREVGMVRWRFAGPDSATARLDEITRGLVELAASAIVRARLNAEKAEMELVAQTEHLRLVLLDTVSHHFRSPLAGILGSVTSILSLPDRHDAAEREFLLIIKEQTNRLSRYVDNFLSVARLETGAIVPNLTEVALEPLIYDVWEGFGEAGGARRFLQAAVDRETFRTDARLLAQVLGNILENAIKYSPEGSVVDVRTGAEDGRLVIRVTDCGPGVAPRSQARIFERFYRMRGVVEPGLGLGLYITRSLAEILGGTVDACNRTDGQTGLVVSVSLPLATSANDE